MTEIVNSLIPGDIGFDVIHGLGHLTVAPGQLLMGDGCRYEHVRLALTNQEFIEAKPPKAEINKFDQSKHGDTLWFRPTQLTEDQRYFINDTARFDYVFSAIKYSWSAYLNIALVKWGFRPEWLKNRVENGRRRICSQLADKYLTDAGIDMLEGVLPGEVCPGDLYYRVAVDPAFVAFRVDGKDPWTWK